MSRVGGSGSGSSSSLNNGANYGFGVGLAGGASTAVAHQGQGVAALLVMLAVLCFMFAYCCWGAPFCRNFCRRHCGYCCCCCCRAEDYTDSESGGFGSGLTTTGRTAAIGGVAADTDQPIINTPTIILLPHGRTFVVHGRIFTQFQADNTGLDLVELGESVMRAQRGSSSSNRHHHHHHHHHLHHRQLQDSQGSIIDMDAETPSKDSMGSIGCFPPPTYESIYGKDEEGDLPPSYSDILLHRFANLPFELEMQDYTQQHHQSPRAAVHRHNSQTQQDSKEDLELRVGPRIINNPIAGSNYIPPSQRYPHSAYASRSLPRRNPSLISNPLDGYYLDNELAGLHRAATLGQRRRSAAAEVTSSHLARASISSPVMVEPDMDNARTNSDELVRAAENILDNRFLSSRSQASRSQNDLMNSRNLARSDIRRPTSSEIYTRSSNQQQQQQQQQHQRRFEESLGQLPRAPSWNISEPDVRSYELNNRQNEEEEEEVEEEDVTRIVRQVVSENQFSEDDDEESSAAASNFQALAGIRESRV